MSATPRLQGYRLSSIVLHWLAGALIVALWVIGQMWEGQPRDVRLALRELHFSLGLIAVVVIGVRLAWRFAAADGAPDTEASGVFDRLAKLVQHLFYLVMLVLIVTGPLAIWFEGRPIPFFNLASLPSPLPKLDGLSHGLETAHIIATKAVVVLFALHVLGALKHLVVDRDGVFMRMVAPRR